MPGVCVRCVCVGVCLFLLYTYLHIHIIAGMHASFVLDIIGRHAVLIEGF